MALVFCIKFGYTLTIYTWYMPPQLVQIFLVLPGPTLAIWAVAWIRYQPSNNGDRFAFLLLHHHSFNQAGDLYMATDLVQVMA